MKARLLGDPYPCSAIPESVASRFHLDWVMFKAQAARDICRGKPGGNSGRCGQ
jgi:hypothetical protein